MRRENVLITQADRAVTNLSQAGAGPARYYHQGEEILSEDGGTW